MNWKRIFLLTVTVAVVPGLTAVSVAKYQLKLNADKAAAVAAATPLAPVPVKVVTVPPPAPPPLPAGDVSDGPIDLSASEYLQISGELKNLVDTQSPREA